MEESVVVSRTVGPHCETRSALRNNRVKSLQRALQLLEVLRDPPEGSSLISLVSRTHLPKGTVHRLLTTLVERNFVEKEGHCYRIGVQCFVTGNAFLGHMDLRARALPALFDLRNRSGEAVQMAVLEGLQVIYIERVQSHRPVPFLRAQVGAILAAYCTALGKALLAFSPMEVIDQYMRTIPLKALTSNTITSRKKLLAELAAVRRLGCAFDRGERAIEVRCIAAPIFDHEGRLVAAMSVAGPAPRMPNPLEGSLLAKDVVETGARISAAIGYLPSPKGVARSQLVNA